MSKHLLAPLCLALLLADPAAAETLRCEAIANRVLTQLGMGTVQKPAAGVTQPTTSFERLRDEVRMHHYRNAFLESLVKDPALSRHLAEVLYTPFLKNQAGLTPEAEAAHERAAVKAYRKLGASWESSHAAQKSFGLPVHPKTGTDREIAKLLKAYAAGKLPPSQLPPLRPEHYAIDEDLPAKTTRRKSFQKGNEAAHLYLEGDTISRISIQGKRAGVHGATSTKIRLDSDCKITDIRTDPQDLGHPTAGLTLSAKNCVPVLKTAPPGANLAEKDAAALMRKIASEDSELLESTIIEIPAAVRKYHSAKSALCREWIDAFADPQKLLAPFRTSPGGASSGSGRSGRPSILAPAR